MIFWNLHSHPFKFLVPISLVTLFLFLVAGFIRISVSDQISPEQADQYLLQYIKQSESQLTTFVKEKKFLDWIDYFEENSEQPGVLQEIRTLSTSTYTLFVYRNGEPVLWSNSYLTMPNQPPQETQKNYVHVKGSSFKLFWSNHFIDQQTYTFVAYIPLHLGNRDHPYAHISRKIPPEYLIRFPASSQEVPVFMLPDHSSGMISVPKAKLILVSYLLFSISLCFLIHKSSNLLWNQFGSKWAILFLLVSVTGFRLLSLRFQLTTFPELPVFSEDLVIPAFRMSLGDVLINVLLMLWISFFLIARIPNKLPRKLNPVQKILLSFSGYLVILGALIEFSRFCQKLVQQTQIRFNFESVFNLDRNGIFALILVILLTFLVFLWSVKIISLHNELKLPLKHKITSGIFALAFIYPVISVGQYDLPFVPYALVAGIFLLLLDIFLEVRHPNFTWMILWLIVLSGFSSILLFKLNRDKDVQIRKEMITSLIDDPDGIALQEINNILNSESYRQALNDIRPVLESQFRKSKYLSSYYNLHFDKQGDVDYLSHSQYEGLEFMKIEEDLDHYIFSIPGDDPFTFGIKKKIAHIPLQTMSFITTPDFKDLELLKQYEYAIYKDRQCLDRNSSQYKNKLSFTIPKANQFYVSYAEGRSELIYNNGTFTVVAGRKLSGLIKPVSLFSYLFVVVVMIALAFLFINSFVSFLPKELDFNMSSQSSLRNKIQFSVLALIVLSFVVVGLVTVFYFRDSAEKNNLDRIKQTVASVQSELLELVYPLRNISFTRNLNDNIKSLATKYQTNLMVYDEKGFLLHASSEHSESPVIPTRMDFLSLLNLKKFSESVYISEAENKNELEFTNAFFTLFNQYNEILGFVGCPIYLGNNASDSRVKDFMGTLLNVYVFLLLIAGAIALAVANSITRPMSVLGQKLKEFKLGKQNELLEWKNKDELGDLINEFNQMIKKLEESAELLAQTEREVAWREMAKQVAHEIKNPLTPMKLSIQHLQNAIKTANEGESIKLAQRVSTTLIEQIDNLSRIASEFSSFAKMPKPKNERINLCDLVTSVHDLFKKRDDMDFNLYLPIDEIFVSADKSHLLRLFNNLLKNAIQAIPEGKRGIIDIKLMKLGKKAVIQVRDNGKGIPQEMQDKVFYPNFTTKSSGTGLGLAISKNIVESLNGKIYFHTSPNEGTTFSFELPSVKAEELVA